MKIKIKIEGPQGDSYEYKGYTPEYFQKCNYGAEREAKMLLHEAETTATWTRLAEKGHVRMRSEPDEIWSMVDLKGDCYNPSVCTDIDPDELKRQERNFVSRVHRVGVWGFITEYWTGREWKEAESCWGFVGGDWQNSGYDLGFMSAAIKEFRAQDLCLCCGQPSPQQGEVES